MSSPKWWPNLSCTGTQKHLFLNHAAYFEQFEGFEVIVHPVNQNGASSNEVSDLDIKKNDRIFVAVEVKDKQFSEQDVDHAAFKASQYGLRSITLVVGVSGSCIGSSREQIASAVLLKRGVNVIFVDLVPFTASIIALHPELSFVTFFSKLQSCAVSARVKDEVYKHIEQTFQSLPTPLSLALKTLDSTET